MTGWIKKSFAAEGVTEWKPGHNLELLEKRFGNSGAVVLMLDVSGSMRMKSAGRTNLERAVSGCERFIEEAIAGDYDVGLILWNQAVAAQVSPTGDGRAARKLLSRASGYTGGNDVVPGLELAESMLFDLDVKDRVIAVFGDGDLGPHAAHARTLSGRVGSRGIRILTLGLGDTSAAEMAGIETENASGSPHAATTETLSDDIHGLARRMTARRSRR
ncbi:hypothetical protein C5B85_11740 [Pseudoclavibacter sp. AY1F1]|uniref:vWA domain-containing protein n=1 Tax=Pseudoclavibacter sp. AY1F1 TaxID=2080583 RepID=UPI000CE8CEAE|nr:VWA domain-containing protein [Pseudoclavibacter sp. AY1F1]PPF43815.1 hypothetical protein C5B85_11740 [Pseudoclavibacter sp. AY1F1]